MAASMARSSLRAAGALLRTASTAAPFHHSSAPSPSHHDTTHRRRFGWRDKAGTKSAQLQIVNALRLGERERASDMLLRIGASNGPLSADDFSFILDYCARTPDPLFVMETWKVMEEKAVDMNQRCCRYITLAFTRGGYLKEAFDWLTYIGENVRVQGVLPIYNIFLRECGNRQSLVDANSCLELMESQLMGKSEITYWEILKFAVLQRNLSAVHDIWKDCTNYYNPSIITLRKFVWVFTRLGDLESAYSVLQHIMAIVNKGNASLVVSASGRYRSASLDIPIPLVGDLPDWKLRSSDKECFLHQQGNLVETEGGSEKSSMDCNTVAKQSLYSIDANLELDGDIATLSYLPKTPNAFHFLGSIFPNGVQKDKQEECFGFSKDNMKQELRANILRGKISVPVMNILRWSFNDVIHGCALSRNHKLAEQLFMQMIDLGLKPSKHTYDGFVKAVIYGRGVSYGMKMMELMEKKSIKPYNDTFAALSIGHSKQLELDVAEDLLERIFDSLPKYIHPFNAFLQACDILDKPERAIHILAKMRSINVKPNIRTYELLFSLFGNVNVPYEKGNMVSHADVRDRIGTIEMDMKKNGIQHSYISMKNLIRALGAEGMIEEMLRYLNVADNMWQTDSYQRSDMYDIVLHALVKAKEIERATDVFRNMRLCGFPASTATYNIMIECCSLLKCFRSACGLVSMMLRCGFFPQRLTYTALIKVLLANDDFEGALALVDQSSSVGIDPDIQLFNTILQEACLKGQIDIIEQIIEHIHEKKIQPDPSTCWYTFSVYVERDLHSTALEALQVLSLRMISQEDTILQEQRAAFEDLIYDEDPYAESRIVDMFSESDEYTATAILNLRWCAIAGLSISWLPEESLWSQRLSSSYGTRKGPT